ncbi:MAG: VOC family protein [Armatimonadetes bacterium]|nr:VOC family protein [Armatimonadota bacterium]
MRLGHVELFCKDCQRTRDFYVQQLEFEEAEVPGGDCIWLRSDGIEVLLRPGRQISRFARYDQSPAALVVYVRDLNEVSERLGQSGVEMSEPDGAPYGLTFRDPDGRWLQAVEGD